MSSHTLPNEQAVMRKVWRVILSFGFLLLLFAQVDKHNIAFAALTMRRDLGLTATMFGICVSIFYVGYIICEIPSNLVMARVGARAWLARISITLGLASAATMLAVGPKSLLVTAIAPKGDDGKPVLANAFSDGDLALLAKAILNDCDMNDGARDGLVSDTRACRFNPERLKCEGEKTDACLSAAQVSALQRYAGPHDSRGRPLYVGWPWDRGIAAPGWRAWKLGTSTTPVPNAIKAGLSNNAIRYVFLTPPDPTMTEAAFDFDRDPARMRASAEFADATSTDLSRFRAHGGKIIFYHGMADPAISALDTQRYYEALTQAQAGAQRFARLFLVPGMNHCSGGTGLDSFNTVAAITAWVEQHQPPDRFVATGTAMPGVSRPICPFPTSAHFTGSGDPASARNFECR